MTTGRIFGILFILVAALWAALVAVFRDRFDLFQVIQIDSQTGRQISSFSPSGAIFLVVSVVPTLILAVIGAVLLWKGGRERE